MNLFVGIMLTAAFLWILLLCAIEGIQSLIKAARHRRRLAIEIRARAQRATR